MLKWRERTGEFCGSISFDVGRGDPSFQDCHRLVRVSPSVRPVKRRAGLVGTQGDACRTEDLGVLWVSPDLGIPELLALQQQTGSEGQRGRLEARPIVTLTKEHRPSFCYIPQHRGGGPSHQGLGQTAK